MVLGHVRVQNAQPFENTGAFHATECVPCHGMHAGDVHPQVAALDVNLTKR